MTELEAYRSKRRFNKTPEPEGMLDEKIRHRFVVHQHQAKHLHYDFRLEMEGVLRSWVVPKGVPLEPGIKRLAVQVEDHPVEYIDFSGDIPERQYGAGKVEIWDSGNYEIINQRPDYLEFVLYGNKLSGNYVLINTDKKDWLLIKRKPSK